MTTQNANRVRLPGFGLDLDDEAKNVLPTALLEDDYISPILTIREYTLMEIMARMTNRSDWETKVFDEAIAGNWKAEILAVPDKDISEQMVDWCIAEVRYKAEKYTETGCVEALDGIFKSDGIISEDLKNDLRRAAAPLEIVPERDKDWHSGSNGQVLNLVHPSLYPLVYGQSRILPYGSVGPADVH